MASSPETSLPPGVLVEKFRSTSGSRLEHLNLALLELERHPDRQETVEEAMREIHTLKGEAKLMGFSALSETAHKTEDLLQLAKNQGFPAGGRVFDVLLKGLDVLKSMVEDGGYESDSEGERDSFHVSADALLAVEEFDSQAPVPVSEPWDNADVAINKLMRVRTAERVLVELTKVKELTDLVGDLVQDQARRQAAEKRLRSLVTPWRGELDELLDRVNGLVHLPDETLREPLDEGWRSVRERVDSQLRRVAELAGLVEQVSDATFEEGLRIAQLDERFREVRMQPLWYLLGSFPRAVRDLGRELGKKVRLEIQGEAIEIDQRILERIKDPLLHLIRNSVDHGIESPRLRLSRGKPEEGRIRLEANLQDPYVQLRVSDDGAGIEVEELRRVAVSHGLVNADEGAELNGQTALGLIFRPGFSTREQATEVSGRGVGLDAVRSEIGALGGSVRVESNPGDGTTFELFVPISTAFQRVLLLEEGDDVYGVPSASVERLLRIPSGQVRSGAGSELFTHEDEVLQAVRLKKLLGGEADSLPRGELPDDLTLVVLAHGGKRVGLVVTRLLGERSLVHRRLDPFLNRQSLIVGSAVLGEGRPVLLLSVPHVVARGGPAYTRHPGRGLDGARARAELRPVPPPAEGGGHDRLPHRVLVVDDSELTREALVASLRHNGYRTMEAPNGQEALDIMAREQPDIVLLDLDMPVMGGLDVLLSIRDCDRLSSIPVLVLSGDNSPEDRQRCLDLGAQAYLVKSAFRSSDLEGVLRRYLTL